MEIEPGCASSSRFEPAWTRFLWTLIGFAAGTGIMAPLILSVELRDRVIGGMIFGGVPLAFVGYLYGRRRAERLSNPPAWHETLAQFFRVVGWLASLAAVVYFVGAAVEPPRTVPIAIGTTSAMFATILFLVARSLNRRVPPPTESGAPT